MITEVAGSVSWGFIGETVQFLQRFKPVTNTSIGCF